MELLPPFLKGAKAAYDSRKMGSELWNALMTKLKGKKSTIVFTGLPGAGKTQLLDRLSGKTEQPGYVPLGPSKKTEEGTKHVPKNSLRGEPKKRLACLVIPGQDSPTRYKAFDELFAGKVAIAGVVHVVSAGLPTVRTPEALQRIKEKHIDDVETYRHHQLQEETDDLEQTCRAVERYMIVTKKPLWLFIAVTKIDLFIDTLERDLSFYTATDSAFVNRLQRLQNRVGSLNLTWEVVAVSAWHDDFVFNGHTLVSNIEPTQQKQYLDAFTQRLIDKC